MNSCTRLRFNYPAIPGPTLPEQITKDLATSPGRAIPRTWITGTSGNSLLQPVAVSDDGVHTRLRFAPSAELPAIFVRSRLTAANRS